ncbi:unnamed protein product [Fusarium graminearum]|uniref:Uncharacterized protein n=1 Tax=Gibberella zeae TaxID=5518 RepID=A0A4E9EGU7_GIBZA|nr:unnamed protein product [Fusarium graminearum]
MFPKTRIHGVTVIDGSKHWNYNFRITPFSLPMVFQICKESRQIAQAQFKRFAIDRGTKLADCQVPYGYCNPKVDALYILFLDMGTGGAPVFGPFRRIMIAVNRPNNSYPMHPDLNDFTTKTSDDRLQLCLVKAEHTIAPPEHRRCESVFPVGLPEPKPLNEAGWPFYKETMTCISEMERRVEDGYGPIVTVGFMPPVSCACYDRFKEMKVAFKAEQAEKARWARGMQHRGRARKRSAGRRRGDEQSTMRRKTRTSVHGMILRSNVRR